MAAIQDLAQRIAAQFSPEKVILFGSYAYGDPKSWSDVDLLIIMEIPEGNLKQMLAVSRALSPHPFGLDILVRTPKEILERTTSGDTFTKEVLTHGKVLYEKRSPRVG